MEDGKLTTLTMAGVNSEGTLDLTGVFKQLEAAGHTPPFEVRTDYGTEGAVNISIYKNGSFIHGETHDRGSIDYITLSRKHDRSRHKAMTKNKATKPTVSPLMLGLLSRLGT